MNSFRGGGMQLHAVPDDERAVDANGKPLPWGYAYADSSLNRKQPIERGPFGRPTTRRATSRTKTATPGAKEDPVVQENLQVFDDIFKRQKKVAEEKETKAPRDQRVLIANARMTQPQTMPDLNKAMASAPPGGQHAQFKEPVEALIYGYALDDEGAAIAHYERVSGGRIYEDYDRNDTDSRYSHLLTNSVRANIPRSLPKEVIRRINTYKGGDHWIKITFDSPEAAERATYFSPVVMAGHVVFIETWRGEGPISDVGTRAAPGVPDGATGAAALVGLEQAPLSSSSLRVRTSSSTAREKAYSTLPSRMYLAPNLGSVQESGTPESTATLATTDVGVTSGSDARTVKQVQGSDGSRPDSHEPRPLKVKGATRIILRPASEALLPVPPWSQRTFGHIPVVGALFGGNPNAKPGQSGGIIGNTVPRKDDGAFDWTSASLYWKTCWTLDRWLGTDLCGLKGDD